MGRFYKTAKPNMIDFMYQVPEQAILGAIKGADAQLERQEQYLTDFQKQLKHQALSPDKKEQQEMLKQYEDQIKQHALKISSSPLEALKQKQGIRELGNTIYEDVTRGKLFAQYSNYAARADFEKRYKEEAMKKDGRVTTKQVEDALAAWDAAYAAGKTDPTTGQVTPGGLNYDPSTGNYRKYGTQELATFMNAFTLGEEAAKGWKEHAVKTHNVFEEGGRWMVKTIDGKREANFNDIFQGTFKELTADQKLKDYNNEQILFNQMTGGDSRVGLTMEDVYGKRKVNEDGTSELEYRTYVDDQGKTQYEIDRYGNKIPVKGGVLWDAAYKAAEKHGFIDTEKGIVEKRETEAEKARIDEQKTKNIETWKTTKSFDYQSAEITKNIVNGETVEEVETNLNNAKTAINNTLFTSKDNYLNVIDNSNLPAKAKDVVAKEIQTRMMAIAAAKHDPEKVTAQFNALNSYIASINKTYGDFVGLKTIANGVESLKQTYVSENNRIHNESQALGDIYNTALKESGTTYAIDIYAKQKEIDKLNKEIAAMPPPSKFDTEETRKTSEEFYAKKRQVNKLINERNALQTLAKQVVNERMRSTNADGSVNTKSLNRNTNNIYSTTGQYLEKVPNMPQGVVKDITYALSKIDKVKDLIPFLLSGSNAKVVIDGKSAPITLNEAMEEGYFDKLVDDGEGTITFIKDNKEIGTYNLGSVGITLFGSEDIGLPKNAYSVPANVVNKTKQGFNTVEFYFDPRQVVNNDVNTALSIAEPYLIAEEITRSGKSLGKNGNEDYNYVKTHNDVTVKYYPNQFKAAGGLYEVKDKKTGEVKRITGADGGQLYIADQFKK
jgi:hypothetical protein